MRIMLNLRTRKSPCSIPSMLALGCTLVFVFVLAAPAHAQFTYSDLFDFASPGGTDPIDGGQLTLYSDGNLYGTASFGGAYSAGTIFSFWSVYNDVFPFSVKGVPNAALTPAVDPNNTSVTYLYGGTNSFDVFRYDPTSGTMKVLHSFPAGKDFITFPPVVGRDGNLYGVTSLRGAAFKIDAASGAYTEFSQAAPGGASGRLLPASDGNLYGETCSTVFSMTTTGTINTVYTFSNPDDCPSGGLTQLTGASSVTLYGVAYSGGANSAGYIFELATDGTGFNDLHDFTGADGSAPQAGLLAATDGNLYGTASEGGANGAGTIFELTPSPTSPTGWSFTKLFDFSGTVSPVLGAFPLAALMQHPNGSFYGVAEYGGANSFGVIYSLTPGSPITTVTLCCNNFVILDQPVQIYGLNMDEVAAVSFAGAPAQFQQISPTYLTAQVPAAAADGQVTVTVINSAGQPEQVESQQALHILPTVTSLDPLHGAVGSQVLIEGGGFANASEVAFGGGVPATTFSVQAPNVIVATVPPGAVSGKITVTTPNGTATSKQKFTVK